MAFLKDEMNTAHINEKMPLNSMSKKEDLEKISYSTSKKNVNKLPSIQRNPGKYRLTLPKEWAYMWKNLRNNVKEITQSILSYFTWVISKFAYYSIFHLLTKGSELSRLYLNWYKLNFKSKGNASPKYIGFKI